MKILYHHRTRAEDGQAVHIRSLIEAFRAEGHEVREVALVARTEPEGGTPGPGPRAENAQPREQAKPAKDSSEKGLWKLVGSVPGFVREIAEYGYSVPARGRILRTAAEFQPDFLYERYAFGNSAGVRASERLNKPLILEVNSPMVLELSRTRGLSFPRLADRVERKIFRSATRVCVVTQVLADMLIEMGVEPERLFVTPNGVHLELYETPDPNRARAELGLADVEGPVLGFVGYYRDWHRLDVVIESLATPELSSAHLVLIGAGPAEDELRAAARRTGTESRVHFAGTRKHGEIPALLPAFDVALVPAINPYASPLKLHEYMAAGRAVIAPDQPNLREILTHRENAWLLPPGDADAMGEALRQLCQNEELRNSLGAAGRRTIELEDLTWRGNARRVIAAAQSV